MAFPVPAATIHNPDSNSPFLLVCEHASNFIPEEFKNLGLTAEDTEAHIAWDIGAKGVSLHLSRYLNATLIKANYSRLLFDCNRDVSESTAIIEVSENTTIPGNCNLTDEQRQQRLEKIGKPFHQSLSDLIQQRLDAGQQTIIVPVHSYTPVYNGEKREFEMGVLYKGENQLAEKFISSVRQISNYTILPNEPYDANHFGNYTISTHAIANKLPYLALEIRQDLISDNAGQLHYASLIESALTRAL